MSQGEVFLTYVTKNFEAAAKAFCRSPGANEWTDLKVAMRAHQHVMQLSAATLESAAREHVWRIAEYAKGDADFEEKKNKMCLALRVLSTLRDALTVDYIERKEEDGIDFSPPAWREHWEILVDSILNAAERKGRAK